MERLRPVVIMDFMMLKPFMKNIAMLIGLGFVYSLVFGNFSMMLSMSSVAIIQAISYPSAVGSTCSVETLYASLPIERRDVVKGRYLYALVIYTVLFLFTLFVTLSFDFFGAGEPLSFVFALTVALLLTLLCLFVSLSQMPIFFRYGYVKSKIIAYIPILVIFLILTTIMMTLGISDEDISTLIASFSQNIILIIIFGFALAILIFWVSYKLSAKFYMERELID